MKAVLTDKNASFVVLNFSPDAEKRNAFFLLVVGS